MASQVSWPTTPSAVSPAWRWKASTAARVPEPKIPSTATEGMDESYWAMVLSQN